MWGKNTISGLSVGTWEDKHLDIMIIKDNNVVK